MKILVIPDSFKGTLSSIQVCDIIEDCFKILGNKIEMIKIPIADGGEGTVDTMLMVSSGQKVYVRVSGPYFDVVDSFFGLLDDGKTAIIEMAACAGLPLILDRLNPSSTTTYGVGQLMKHALDLNVDKIILGLGGSATNDAGVGCASALGVKFNDQYDKSFIPVGGTLNLIKHIDIKDLDERLKKIELISMCDIDNPLYGKNGAAHIFGPQKGADNDMVNHLDYNLKSLSEVVSKDLNFSNPFFPGAGSAGGMGYGMKVFLGSSIQMGIDTILNQIHFEQLIKDVDLIITGEGQLDNQSLRGKAVIGIARKAKMANVKTIAIVGNIKGDRKTYIDEGLNDIFVTNQDNKPFSEIMMRADLDLRLTIEKIINKHVKPFI